MSDRRLQLEMQAAQRLKEMITAAYGDDVELIRDSIEGQTNLKEAIAWAALELADVEGMKDGIEIAIAKLRERLSRHCKKATDLRDAIQTAMEMAELTSIKTPAATLSVRPSPASVEITDEAAIPAVFMVQPPPPTARPDKRAIAAALKDGQAIPGVTLSNQPPTLSARFK